VEQRKTDLSIAITGRVDQEIPLAQTQQNAPFRIPGCSSSFGLIFISTNNVLSKINSDREFHDYPLSVVIISHIFHGFNY
jgi:hypothetical protein